MTASPVRSGPEVLFGVEPGHVHDRTAWSSMPVTPWLAGPDGRLSIGALGVLVDDVLGLAIIGERPAERWSVSGEITVDVFAGLGTASGALRGEATVIDTDDLGAFATGTVVDGHGTLVAVTSQRGRYVDPAGMAVDTGYRLEPHRRAGDLGELVGLQQVDDGWTLPLSPAVLNPLDRLHGGIAIAVCDLAAVAALAASDGPPLTTSGLRVHYLRPVAGASLEVRARVERRGRTSALVQVDGVSAGRTCVRAVVSAGPVMS